MSTEHLVSQLEASSKTYEVSDATLETLREKQMIALLGPFAVGKTTLMREAVSHYSDEFHRVRSFTTREPRHGEDRETYRFYDHSVESLQNIQEQVDHQELVQFMVHPTTKKVYGSTIDDYGPTPTVMLDLVPKGLSAVESLPFKRIDKVETVAAPKLWRQRMEERLIDNDPEDIASRLAEADHNITWALDQGDEVIWLDNTPPAREGAENLKSIADDTYEKSLDARFIGESLLREIQTMRK